MRKVKFTINRLALLLLVVTSLITVGIVAYERHQTEASNDKIEITLNYDQISELAKQSDQDILWWLGKFEAMGATSVSIIEETLINYIETHFGSYGVSGTFQNDLTKLEAFPSKVKTRIVEGDPYDLVIGLEDKGDFDRVLDGLLRYEGLEIDVMYGQVNYMVIDRSEEDILIEQSNDLLGTDGKTNPVFKRIIGVDVLELPIGFEAYKVDQVHSAGMDVLLRPINNSRFGHDMIDNYKEELQRFDYANPVPLLLSSGADVLGFISSELGYVEETEAFLDEYDFTLALIESNVQRQYKETYGLDNLVAAYTEDKFVRVFTMWSYIQERYIYPGYSHGEEIGNSMHRAITERNIRVIHFNPFMWNEEEYVTNIDDYEAVFSTLEERLSDLGYSFGRFTVLDDIEPSKPLRILLYIQVLLFGLVILNIGVMPIGMKVNGVLTLMSVAAAIGSDIVAPNASVKLFAFLGSIVFASLASIVYYRLYLGNARKGTFVNGVWGLLLSGIIALYGGLYIGSIMAKTEYFLEIELFTGVKLSLLGPIAVAILFVTIEYIKEKIIHGDQNALEGIKKETLQLLDYSIQMKHLILIGIAGVMGYVYLARSGHESGVQPMQIEIIIRNFLENALIARPRNKEFLIAFPIVILGVAYKDVIKSKMIEIKYLVRLIIMSVGGIGLHINNQHIFTHKNTYISLDG